MADVRPLSADEGGRWLIVIGHGKQWEREDKKGQDVEDCGGGKEEIRISLKEATEAPVEAVDIHNEHVRRERRGRGSG